MKILIYSDVHWAVYSSILRTRGKKFSTYLEGLINSMNWVMDLGRKHECKLAICAGDFFDREDTSSEELSALQEVNWLEIPHYFLCGNHELGSSNHEFSSAKIFDLLPTARAIDKPCVMGISDFVEIAFLPYILESERKPIENYLVRENKKRLLITHNDIAGIQLGGFISKTGFSIEELESIADKVINGHLHNGGKVSDKIINIGSLSGINFSNDSLNYDYGAFIFDTETFTIDVFENPYSFNFYKFDTANGVPNLYCVKNNGVITLKCNADEANYWRDEIKKNNNIIQSRLILNFNSIDKNEVEDTLDLSVDHISEFKKFIETTLGKDKLVEEELTEVCK